jgi:sugar lactone lactonase YvrE
MKCVILVWGRLLVIAGVVLGCPFLVESQGTTPPPYTWTTFAGKAGQLGTNDGPRSTARFFFPHGVAVDTTGSVYVMEIGNDCVRKITTNGTVSTVARIGPAQALSTFINPYLGAWGVAVDTNGNIYVANTGNQTIVKITTTGATNVLAGSPGLSGNQNGTNGTARFYYPATLTVNDAGMIWVADSGNNLIREVTPDGAVTTLAAITTPAGVCLGSTGNVYAASESLNRIYSISSTGAVTSLATGFNGPHGGAVDAAGNVYVADMNNHVVKRVAPGGVVTTIGGLAGKNGSADGVGSDARFATVRGIAVDASGNVYVSDYDNQTIRKGVPFAVTNYPQSQAVLVGASVNLSVGVTNGSDVFTYQWLFNGTPLPDQTNASLVISPVIRTNSGVYSVFVSNTNGNWLSLDATVRALVPPVFQTPVANADGTIRLLFQDSDEGLPYDLSQVQVQWRTNLPGGTDTNWQALTSQLVVTNGFVQCDDTGAPSYPSKFYRVWEH